MDSYWYGTLVCPQIDRFEYSVFPGFIAHGRFRLFYLWCVRFRYNMWGSEMLDLSPGPVLPAPWLGEERTLIKYICLPSELTVDV